MEGTQVDVKSLIYKITHKNSGCIYVGQTRTHLMSHGKYRPAGIQRRWKQHQYCARRGTLNYACKQFAEDIIKDGPEGFTVDLLETCLVHEANAKESMWIKTLKSREAGNYQFRPFGDKEEQRQERYRHLQVEKAILMVIEGPDPRISVFFQTADAKTNRTMKRTVFYGRGDSCKQRAEEFARQHTNTLEYCTGRTRKTHLLSSWQDFHKETPFVKMHIRGPIISHGKSFAVYGETKERVTIRQMKKTVFLINTTDEEAKQRAVEFAQHFNVPIVHDEVDKIQQKKGQKRKRETKQ